MRLTCVRTVASLRKRAPAMSTFEKAARDELQDVEFALGQLTECGRTRGARWRATDELLDHALHDRRRDLCLPCCCRTDRGDELRGWCVLEQEPARARFHRVVDVLVRVERRQHQPRTRTRRDEPPGRLDAVHVGHAYILWGV